MAGRFRDGPWDVGGRLFGIIIYAFPVFFLGFLFQLGRHRSAGRHPGGPARSSSSTSTR